MLKQLLIRSFALVDELSLGLDAGLTVLTGETGAGKSIVVDAVNFLLGSRADRELIRYGCERAYVEGIFCVEEHQAVWSFLVSQGFIPDGDELTISRELTVAGRGSCRISGTAVPLSLLKQFGSMLMDIHGQHEHQSLLDESRHVEFLDAFAGEEHQRLLESVKTACEKYLETAAKLDGLRERNAAGAARAEALLREEKELALANVRVGEEEELKRDLDRLRSAGRIAEAAGSAYSLLYSAPDENDTAYTLAGKAAAVLSDVVRFDREYEGVIGRIESVYYELEDIGIVLRAKKDEIGRDGQRLGQLEERLDLLRRLSRKYLTAADELPALLTKVRRELEDFVSLEGQLEQYARTSEEARKAYAGLARLLTESRERAARILETQMEEQLEALNMKGTRFIVAMQSSGRGPSPAGNDAVRFLLSANAGEEPRALSKIVSGGELSRMMLALKSLSARRYGILSMVFDEIDAGISGRTAQVVAEKLWDIARHRQVICVTHLQQIAAMASSHHLVEKKQQSGRTVITVRRLNDEDRVAEMSRLLGGKQGLAGSGAAHARALLREAALFRETGCGQR